MNKLEKIFSLIINFGDSEKRIPEINALLQTLNQRLLSVLQSIREIGKAEGLKEASKALGVYTLTVEKAEKTKKKLVEVDKDAEARMSAEKKYIDDLKAKYGNLIFTKKDIVSLTRNYTILQRAEKGSVEELTAKINVLNTAWKKMGAEKRNSAQGKQITAELKQMRDSLRQTTVSAGDFSRNIGNYAGSIKKISYAIGATWTAIRGVFNLFRSSIKTITDFEQANANLATVLGKSAADIKPLTNSALDLGRTTEYTASQVTQLQTELAKLGFGERQIEAMQAPVLQFATAVGANLPDAAAFAGAALRAFDLDAKDTEEMLSILAVATNKSALSFPYLQTALAIVSPVAKTFGFDIKDTAALLGTLANSGFDASMAATATRNILLHLADANGKLAKALGQPVRTLPELIAGLNTLRERGIDLAGTLELTDKRSVAAFNTFLNGADNLQTLRGELESTDGELKRIQEERLNTVEGSVKLLNSAWEGLVLSFSNSKGVFKTVIELITDAINGLNILLNPDSQIAAQKNLLASQMRGTYQNKGIKAYNQEVSIGADYWSKRYISAKDKYQNSGGLLGANDYKTAQTMWSAFKQAVIDTDAYIKQGAIEEVERKAKDAANEKSRITAEKAAKLKALEESAKAKEKADEKARKEAERKAQEEQAYTASRKAQADAIAQYDIQHREAEVQRMADSVDKKIKLNDLATEKAKSAAQKEYDAKIEALNKQQEAYKDDPAKFAEIEGEKAVLLFAHEQKCTDIADAGASARVKILRDATEEELKEYAKIPGVAAEAERQITENKKREVEKRLKLSKKEITDADDKFVQNESIADATYGTNPKDKDRHAARLKNEIELRQAKAQTYMADLESMQKNGETESAAYAQTIANLGLITQELKNLAKGLQPNGNGGGFKGWLMRTFEITPEEVEQLKQQAWDLASQIGNAMIDAQKQASQRRLNNEKKTIDAEYKIHSKLLDDKRDKGLISEKTYQKEMEKLEADKAKKEEAAEKAAFEREKKLNIKQVLINTALSIAKTFAEWGWPMGIPFAALAAASGAIQIAAISSQKYAQGGLIPLGDGMGVVEGRSHAQGGHRLYLDGRPIGEIEGDELIAIVNKHDARRIGALSAANSVHGRKFAQGGLISPGGYRTNSVAPPAGFAALQEQSRMELYKQQDAERQQRDATTQLLLDNIEAINQRIDTLKVVVVESDITEVQDRIKKIKVKSTW